MSTLDPTSANQSIGQLTGLSSSDLLSLLSAVAGVDLSDPTNVTLLGNIQDLGTALDSLGSSVSTLMGQSTTNVTLAPSAQTQQVYPSTANYNLLSSTQGAYQPPTSTQYGYNAMAVVAGSTAYGAYTRAIDFYSIALGYACTANGKHAIAIGNQAFALASQSIAIGSHSRAAGIFTIAIGTLANTIAGITQAIAIGSGSQATATGQFICGSKQFSITDIYFGQGQGSTTFIPIRIHGTDAVSGLANFNGSDVIICGGMGTGTATGGKVLLQVSPKAAGSGSTYNALVTGVYLDSNLNVGIGPGTALATTAINGDFYLPSCAGAPTGVPSLHASFATVPCRIDTTNGKFWAYYGGAWHFVTLT